MDAQRVAAKLAPFLATALLGLLAWLAVEILKEYDEKIRTLREAHLRHLEWHADRSKDQPSVWRVR